MGNTNFTNCKHCYYIALIFSFILFSFKINGQNSNQPLSSKWCWSNEINDAYFENPANQQEILDRALPATPNCGTYGNFTGYGPGCVNDCDLSKRMPEAGCSDPPLFQIPVVYRVSTGTGCPANSSQPAPIPSQANLDATLDIANAFYACANLPFELVKCTNYEVPAGGTVQADGSTVYENLDCNFDVADMAGTITDIPNVVNIYVFEDSGNGTGCNGFAYFPGGPEQIVMSNACYGNIPANVDCADIDLGFAQVFVHEIGHYLGLLHTHDAFDGAGGSTCDDPTTAADDCTSGDFISDTDEDPDYSGGEIATACGGCNTGNASSNCAFNNAGSPACTPYGAPNTINNIMSYNIFSGCISEFTDCQQAKMIDALLCSRNNMVCCDPAVVDSNDGSLYMADNSLSMCIGGTPPTFTITDLMGGDGNADNDLTSGCIAWYDSNGNLLSTGNSFTPNPAPTMPGVYTYYFDDDVNDYTTTVNTCNVRKSIQIIVLDDPGDATADNGTGAATATDACEGATFTLDANLETVTGANMVGWYFSDSPPSGANCAADAATLAAATTSTGTANAFNLVYQSNTNDPLTELNSFTIDCDALEAAGGDDSYYLTPFVAYGGPIVTCSASGAANSTVWTFGAADMVGGSSLANPIGPIDANCIPAGYTLIDCQIEVSVTGCSSTDPFTFFLQPSGSCFPVGTTTQNLASCSPGSTVTFTNADINTAIPGFNPLTDQFCVTASNGNGFGDLDGISHSVTINCTYTSDDALTLWNNNNSPNTICDDAGDNCLFGAPIEITCNCVEEPCDAMAGEPAMATETACAAGTGPGMNGELDASAVDLSTIFGPATGTDVVTNYVVFDQATGEFVGASSTAIADLASLGCSGTVCVKQMAYTQETLDAITSVVDGALTPFGFAPLTPIDLAGFLTFLNNLFGPYTEADLNTLLTNGINVNLFGVIPINIPFPDFCYDFSDAEVCITVVNCAPVCDFNTCNAIDVVICGLNWDISGNDQYSAVGTEGTNLNTEIGFTIQATDPAGNVIMGSAFYDDGFEMGTVNPGIILTGLQNSCPGAADAVIDIEICFWEDDSFVVDPFNFNVGEQPNMDYDDCGDVDNEFFIPPFGPTLMFPDDPFGGPECGSTCETFMLDLTAASGAGSFAGTNYNADYIFTCAPEACVCPTEVAVADEAYDICDGGLATEVGDWQTATTGANPLDAVQDPCVFGTIVYSSVTDGDPAFPDGILPDGVHTGADPCVNEIQTVYAYLQCDAPDAMSNIQTTYAQISRLDLTIWPAIQTAMVDNDGDCGPAINTLPCPGYMVTNDYDGNGATPDFSAEMAMGNINFTVTNPGAPADCLSLDVAATFNCVLPPPIPDFDCPGTMVDKCAGTVSLNAVDNEMQTAGTSVGTWTGSAAGYVVLNGAGIGDDEFDPTNAPIGVPLTLVLTLTDGGMSASTVECTIIVVKNCAADGGQF